MASIQQWINTTRLRDTIAVYGHAMPIGLVSQSSIGARIGFTNLCDHSRSVPISRGSPPIS